MPSSVKLEVMVEVVLEAVEVVIKNGVQLLFAVGCGRIKLN